MRQMKNGQYVEKRKWGTAYYDTPKRADLSRDENAVSPVIAVILMVAITVVLAATVFVLVSDIGSKNEPAPAMSFTKDEQADTLRVTQVDRNDLTWTDFTVTGCTAPTGTVDAGDDLTACAGDVKIVYKPSNSLVYQTTFA